MRKIMIMVMSVVLLTLTSCSTDYFEPVFGFDDLPEVIDARGGTYRLTYSYDYYETRASFKDNFEWEFRVLINGREYYRNCIDDYVSGSNDLYYFLVDIPENPSILPRSVVVEVSTHVRMDYEDWWGDWTPIASSVQNGF